MKKVESDLKVIRIFKEDTVSFDRVFSSIVDSAIDDVVSKDAVMSSDCEVA